MNCEQARVSMLKEEGCAPDPSVEAHVGECGACQRFTRGMEPLRAMLATALEPPPADAWERLRPRVSAGAGANASRPGIWSRGLRHGVSFSAAAAALVAVVWFGHLAQPFPSPSGKPSARMLPPRASVQPSAQPSTDGPSGTGKTSWQEDAHLAGPGREDADLRSMRLEVDYLQRDMRRF